MARVSLLTLPTEALTQIFEALYEDDLLTCMTSQAVCQRLRNVIQRMLAIPTAPAAAKSFDPAQQAIHPDLVARFGMLFAFHVRELDPVQRERFTNQQPDIAEMFRCLPWAATAATRDPYLRPGASWRRLRPTRGRHRITRLELCKVMHMFATRMSYTQIDLLPRDDNDNGSGELTVGVLYDLLLTREATFGVKTTGWKLLPGKHLPSYDDYCLVFRKRHVAPPDAHITSFFADDHRGGDTAVLYVRGVQSCKRASRKPDPDGVWRPEATTSQQPSWAFFRWQGCAPRHMKLS